MATTAKTEFEQDAQGRWVIPKDPNAVLDYTFDWSKWLAKIADTITSVSFTLGVGATITEVSHSNTTTLATIKVSGGTVPLVAGTLESITCRIVTVAGRTDERTFYLQIVER